MERSKNELLDRLSKLSNESESIVNQLEAAELKASAAEKAAGTMETQLQETQVCFKITYLFNFLLNKNNSLYSCIPF